MLKSQETSLKLSEKRQKINDLLGKDERSESEINELDDLTKSVQGLEIEFRAALTAEDAAVDDAKDLFGNDGEAAEIRQLRGRATLQNYVISALEHRAPVGVEAEFNAALGISQSNRFPLVLLAGNDPERRATSDTDTTVDARPWLDRLFAETAAAYLGISFMSVSPGVAIYPVTSAGGSGAQRGRTQAADTAAWTVDVTELKPARNAIFLEYAKEDDLRIPMLEESLIRDLRAALIQSIDRAIFVGDDGARTKTKLISWACKRRRGVTEKTLTQSHKVQAEHTLRAFNSLVDGIHATDLDDLRIVASEGSYQLWTGSVLKLTSQTASVFKTMAQFLNDSRVMWRVRELESATTNDKFGAFISLSRGLTGAAAAPVWTSAELIRDVYTKSKKRRVPFDPDGFLEFWIAASG